MRACGLDVVKQHLHCHLDVDPCSYKGVHLLQVRSPIKLPTCPQEARRENQRRNDFLERLDAAVGLVCGN